jgi:hypothetical protein
MSRQLASWESTRGAPLVCVFCRREIEGLAVACARGLDATTTK